MRRLLLLVPAAAIALSAVPAGAAYLLGSGCADDDYRVVDLTVAGRELVEVCTDDNPLPYIADLRCTPVTCR